jgi:hypothetical protein
MKTLLSLLLIAISLTSLHSFAQDNPLFRHLPPDATAVFQVNVPALASKLSWQELAQKMSMAPKGKSDRMMDMMKNPLITGIDIAKDFFVAETDKDDPNSATYTTIILHLADSAKFVAFLRKQEPGLRFFNYPNKGRGAAAKDKYGAAWDKDFAVLTIVKPGAGDQMPPPPPKGKTALPAPKHPAPNYAVLAAKKSFEALKGFEGSVYTSDPVFKAGFSDDADVHMWAPVGMGLTRLMKNLMHKNPGGNAAFSAKAMGLHRSNAHTLTALRFETGKISLKSSTLYPPDSLAFYTKFSSRPLNTDLVTQLPKGKLLAMINLHFDPSAITDMLDMSHSRAKVDSMLATKGLTTDNITRSFKGDILLAVLEPEDQPADSSGKSKQPSIYIVTTINDLPSFMTFAGKLNLMKDSTASGDSTMAGQGAGQGLIGKMKMAYTLKDNILVISTSKPMADAWFGSTEKRSTDFIPAQVKDNPFSLFIDLKTVGNFLQDMTKKDQEQPSGKNKKILQVLSAMDTFTLASGAIQDGKVVTTIELRLTDSSENSLNSLLKLMQ